MTHICVTRPQWVKKQLKLGHGWLITTHYKLWDVITYPCRNLSLKEALFAEAWSLTQLGVTLFKFCINTLGPRQDGCHFPDDIFRCISLNENIWFTINISLSFVLKGPIYNIPELLQIMAWHRSGDKPLSEPMMISLPSHTCITRPQWVNSLSSG